MGSLFSRFLQAITFSKRPCRILIIGLDGAGKTTLLYKLKLDEIVVARPTIAFNVETIEYKNIRFTMWDVSLPVKNRGICHHYYPNKQGIIFLTDSKDAERMNESKEELWRLLEADDLWGLPLLVLANKQDLDGALSPSEVTEMLGLNQVTNRKWIVQGSSVINSQGFFEGLDWMADKIT